MGTVTPIDVIVYSLSANGVLDDASPMYAYVKVPSIITSVTECIVSLAFRQFSANAKTAAASGSLTSDSGGGATSGSSSAASSSNGTESLGAQSTAFGTGSTGAASAGTAHTHTPGSLSLLQGSFVTSALGHTHPIPHTHTTPNHQHTVPTHTHTLTYGTYEEAYPASHSVTVKTYERVGGVWTLRNTSAAITADLADLDLTSVITGPGDWQLRIQSAAAQPNAGRLGLDLYGAITAQIG